MVAQARIPTVQGVFDMRLFQEAACGLEHVALVLGSCAGSDASAAPVVRIHSECMTGDLFGSLRCDCGPQLQQALTEIGRAGRGVLLYLRQEGRGIGLVNKLKAYALQDQGLDTVQANEYLGFAADLRDFDVAAQMLRQLGVEQVGLLTNNPRKVRALESAGIRVVERREARTAHEPENHGYLLTKVAKLGHLMDWLSPDDLQPHSEEQV